MHCSLSPKNNGSAFGFKPLPLLDGIKAHFQKKIWDIPLCTNEQLVNNCCTAESNPLHNSGNTFANSIRQVMNITYVGVRDREADR